MKLTPLKWVALATISASVCGCATSWTGRYLPIDGSRSRPDPRVDLVELELADAASGGGVNGELRTHEGSLGLILEPVEGSDDLLRQRLTIPASYRPFRLPLQDNASTQRIRGQTSLVPGAYQVQVVRFRDRVALSFFAERTEDELARAETNGVGDRESVVVVFGPIGD